jgi:hypothetical protein
LLPSAATTRSHASISSKLDARPLAPQERLEVHPGAERAARPGQHPDPQVAVAVQFVGRRRQRAGRRAVKRVPRLGPADGDDQHVLAPLDRHWLRHRFLPVGSVTALWWKGCQGATRMTTLPVVRTLGIRSEKLVATHLRTKIAQRDDNDTDERFQRVIRSYTKLISLVKAGNAAAAERHWRSHMEGAAQYLLKDDLRTRAGRRPVLLTRPASRAGRVRRGPEEGP